MTEFYGNPEAKRLECIYSTTVEDINNVANPVGFIHSKNMLLEFALKNYTEGIVQTQNGVFHPCEVSESSLRTDWRNMDEVSYEEDVYYIGEDPECFSQKGTSYGIFRELPKIINDNIFKWKYNSRYGAKETVITAGNFEYYCIVKDGGDATVEIKYAKCENKHRNKVTIASIDVYDASNEDILKAIEQWKTEFMSEMNGGN